MWFGFKDILLSSNCTDPFAPKTVRSSAGYITHCRVYENIDTAGLKALRDKQEYKIIGTVAEEGQDLRTFRPANDERLILLFGSEAHGLSREARQLCERLGTIPKLGGGESLNLATSVALFLYQLSAAFPVSRRTYRDDN